MQLSCIPTGSTKYSLFLQIVHVSNHSTHELSEYLPFTSPFYNSIILSLYNAHISPNTILSCSDMNSRPVSYRAILHTNRNQLLSSQSHFAISVCFKQNLSSIELHQSPEHIQQLTLKQVSCSPLSSNPAV